MRRLAQPRTLTWITGVVAFAASVVECFTGYVSQQNFDSQWISTSGKDAFNSVGIGAFFNVMNTGQMLMWHIVLLPIVLIAITGAHVLLVRVRGVSHPIDTDAAGAVGRGRLRRRAIAAASAASWRGTNRRYDILKEGAIAAVIVLALTLGLAGCCPPQTSRRSPSRRAGPGADGQRAHPRAQRRAGHRPAVPAAVLRHELHQAAAVHRGRGATSPARPRRWA